MIISFKMTHWIKAWQIKGSFLLSLEEFFWRFERQANIEGKLVGILEKEILVISFFSSVSITNMQNESGSGGGVEGWARWETDGAAGRKDRWVT